MVQRRSGRFIKHQYNREPSSDTNILKDWQTSLSDSSKALNYRIFKIKFEFEEYFNILNIGDAIRLCRFRTTNHYLPLKPVDGEKTGTVIYVIVRN